MNKIVIKKTLMGMGIILGVFSVVFLVLALIACFPLYSIPALIVLLITVAGYRIGQEL